MNDVGIGELRFGSSGQTVHELFDYYYGDGIGPDANPYDVRERLLFLGRRWQEAQLERTISQQMHGTKQVGIWNNIITMLDRVIRVVESVNMSLCNELRRLE